MPDGAQQHRDWLSLVEISGPFLSLPVLRSTWPTLDALDPPVHAGLRRKHASWLAAPAREQRAWIDHVLRDVLGWGDELRWQNGDTLDPLALVVAEHDTRITPGFALMEPGSEIKPGSTRLVGLRCAPGSRPDARVTGDSWAATPVDRVAHLCRARDVPLGLVTDGRWWTLVRAPRNRATSTATFDAAGWSDAAERDVVRAFRSILCRKRFFGVAADETLTALLDASEDSQEDITEALGVQVRQAVELLVAAIGRADTAQRERGEPELIRVDAAEIYRGAVSVMMRIVFLLFAEERKMLPSDNELYAASYSAGRLCAALERRAVEESADDLEHSFSAWHRLLALFDAVYWGVDHPRLWMYPHDGPLFDATRFPWLPRNVDDRTVLHMLRAVQYVEIGTGRNRERRRLSFRELDVEQIGLVYEGLLGFDGFRADEVIVSLVGKAGLEREVALRELESLAAKAQDVDELATRIAEDYKDSGIGSARAVARRLAPLSVAEHEQHLRRLLSATRGDYPLAHRLSPFAGIIRRDLRDLPVVIMPGELFVTESPLRANTGTHYTPRHLAEMVVEHALEPLVYSLDPLRTADRAEWRPASSADILALKIADIAMGSGAFLVSAARYLGDRLVEARAREGDARAMAATVSRVIGDSGDDPVVIEARREVIEHCLYGVDINPMAVEMAKVSLWLISMDAERPFTFLDDRLIAGDSLLGITVLDQLRNMHVKPARGREIHRDLFAWTESTDALLAKVADTERQIADLPLRFGDPLGWLDDRRKLVQECREDTQQLRLLADLLIGAMLVNATDGDHGLTRGSIEAARLANGVVRDGEEDIAREQALRWLRTDSPRIGFPRQPMHWPLVFVDVFAGGGFDAIIGNNPYLGGQKITGALGHAYREYLIEVVGNGVRGSADLVAYFVLRAHSLLKATGQTGLIATNTLAQGDTREVGLDQLVGNGVTIRRSIKSDTWPSKSALEYCAVWTSRTPLDKKAERIADGLVATAIRPSLDPASSVTGKPERLTANSNRAFQGSIVLGLGFTIEPNHAAALIEKDPRNEDVLFSYLNGQDLNSRPDCSASRWVINFHDWPEERAKTYRECYEQVRRLVKPERGSNNRKVYREYWWQYAEKRPAMSSIIVGLHRVVVIARVSKPVMPIMVSTRQVISEQVFVFATDDTAMLALLSSAPHYWWAATRASTLETRIRYTPSDVFETLPLPELTQQIRELGDRLDTYRRDVMLSRQAGLTKTYNLVFDPDCHDADIVELRRIHTAIDEATVHAYGWDDLLGKGLYHGFHKAGAYTRYTIGPAAQREILDRLLELNHARYADEVAAGLHIKSPKGRKKKPDPDEGALF